MLSGIDILYENVTPLPAGRYGTSQFICGPLLDEVIVLHKRNAQWGDILTALNPTRDPKTQEILNAIRGPHMFAPRTALGVIEWGCRSVHPAATVIEALNAALENMNKVLRCGD